jgi:tetratricopeptide (TPR) repeat protein
MEKTDEELAIQFYQADEYEKARALFDDIFKKNDHPHLVGYYLDCLIQLKDYESAERILKKEERTGAQPWVHEVDLGWVYSLQGKDKEAEKTFNAVVGSLLADEVRIQSAAAAFARRGLDGYAVKTYVQGRKLMGYPYAFAKDLAALYARQGLIEAMLEEYLQYGLAEPGALDEVKSSLAGQVEDDAKYEVIKTGLVRKTQSEPNQVVYVELLSWVLVGKGEYYAAYIQLKSIDMRMGEGGARVFELARVCQQNREYRVAEQAYEYIMQLGEDGPYYYQASLGAINMKYSRVTESGEYSETELTDIETAFLDFVNDPKMPLGEKYKGYLKLAEIQALYLGKIDQAIGQLSGLAENPRIPAMSRGEIQLRLADYMLMQGQVWDAKLTYWQVEKEFKDNPLAHTAKYMKAKISFYTGEFELAQSFLTVLKGSTSELIANDALYLSLLIQDNLGLDTTTTALELFAKADLKLFMNQLDEADMVLDTLVEFFMGHSLTDDVYLLKGDIALRRRDYDKALGYYALVYNGHGDDILADDALYRAANILEYRLKDEWKAYELLGRLALDYQGSVFVVDAGNRYRALRERNPDFLDREGESTSP